MRRSTQRNRRSTLLVTLPSTRISSDLNRPCFVWHFWCTCADGIYFSEHCRRALGWYDVQPRRCRQPDSQEGDGLVHSQLRPRWRWCAGPQWRRVLFGPYNQHEAVHCNGQVVEFRIIILAGQIHPQRQQGRSGMSLIVFCTENVAGKQAGQLATISLQRIKSTSTYVWACPFALEMSSCKSTGYLDMRIYVYTAGSLHNLHVTTMISISGHIIAAIFDTSDSFSDVVGIGCRNVSVSVETDGESKMTVRIWGVATRF